MPKLEDTIEKIKSKVTVSRIPLSTEVMQVLSLVAPPGEEQDLKLEVIKKLYPGANNNAGVHLAEAVESYREF